MFRYFSPDRTITLIFLFLVTAYSGFSQTFIGNISDINGLPVKGAIVTVTRSNGTIEHHYSDDNGRIEMLNLPFGKLNLEINKEGYQPVNMTTWYTIQTRHDLDITLEKTWDITMDSVTVTASTQLADFDGIIRMNRSQYKTMAGSFQDPSRVVLHYPGFSTDNDGTNAFFFRGLPGYTNSWQLSDAEIVNPNHLATAGNRGDALSVNSGGVNVLSSSVIGTYEYRPSVSSIRQNNSLAGISHIELADKMTNFVDLSLIGAEAGYGFQHKNKNTYATARYSFVGLLEKMGVPFGNESINYQDISLVSDLIKNQQFSLKGYAIYGQSSNVHNALPKEETKTIIKDFQDIVYKSTLGIAGIKGNYRMANNRFLHFTLNYSRREDQNENDFSPLYPGFEHFNTADTRHKTALVSAHVRYQQVIGIHQINGGLRTSFTNQVQKIDSISYSLSNNRLYPYAEYTANWKNWHWSAGLALHNFKREDSIANNTINYSVAIERKFSNQMYVRISHRLMDQHVGNSTIRYDFIHAKTLSTEISTGRNAGIFSWKISGYYNDVHDNNSLLLRNGAYLTTFNGLDYGIDGISRLGTAGFNQARTLGLESWSTTSIPLGANLLEMTGTLAFIKSEYSDKEGDWLPAQTDLGFSGSFSVYYTIQRPKYEWNLGGLFHGRQGVREYNFTEMEQEIFWNTQRGMEFQQEPYSRLDLRIVFTKKGGKKRQHRISLDIQNVLNKQNPGFLYYDVYLNAMTRTTQLGLVPVLGYRFEY